MTLPLPRLLDSAWTRIGDAALCVGFSGGGDSMALLHALAAVRTPSRKLRALHVNHGLHADSTAWAESCRALCDRLNIPLRIVDVEVQLDGEGLEAAARHARYAAFAEALAADERLVTAHHREDQAETVLLKLLRGAGPHGLGGMRELRPLGRGQLWRPLLSTPRQALHAYLEAEGLACIDDPANGDPRLARSFLREDVIPRLRAHWPGVTRTLAHVATLQQAQADFLDMHAQAALDRMLNSQDRTLDTCEWSTLHPALRTRVLESWLHDLGLPAPNAAQQHELERQIREAAGDRVPRIAWPGAEIRIWRGRLHAQPPQEPVPTGWTATWHGDSLPLPAAAGILEWLGSPGQEHAPPRIQVAMNVNGLHLRPHGDRHTRALRDLFQQAAVPPWIRRRCPLLYDERGELLAVADLWSTDAGEALFRQTGLRPHWLRSS